MKVIGKHPGGLPGDSNLDDAEMCMHSITRDDAEAFLPKIKIGVPSTMCTRPPLLSKKGSDYKLRNPDIELMFFGTIHKLHGVAVPHTLLCLHSCMCCANSAWSQPTCVLSLGMPCIGTKSTEQQR